MSNFPTKQNAQPCKNGCGTKIYLSDKKQKGSYLPYELDDSIHDCPNYQKLDKFATGTTATVTATAAETSISVQKGPTVEQLKIWLDKLAKNGIYIDIKSIMNVKEYKK